jgi:hypothetical protein
LEAPGIDAIEAGLTGLFEKGGVGEEAVERGGESGEIACGEDGAVGVGVDEVRSGADGGAGDDGFGGVHDFVDDEAPGFEEGGDNEEVAEVVEGGEFGLVFEASEVDLAGDELVGELFEVVAEFAVADEDEGGRGGWCEGWKGGEGAEEEFGVFFWDEFAAEEDDGLIRGEAKGGTQLGAVGGGFGSAGLEEGVVDGVGDVKNLVIRDAVGAVELFVEGANGEEGGGLAEAEGEDAAVGEAAEEAAFDGREGGFASEEEGNVLVTGDFPGRTGVGVVPAVDPESGRGAGGELSLQLVLKPTRLVGEGSGGCSGIEDGVRVAFEEGDVPGDGLTELFIEVPGGGGG